MKKSELNREKFSERLKKALAINNKDGWGSGAYLKSITGVTQKAANKWLNCESIPNKEKLIIISKALGVNSSWLEYGEGEISTKPLSNNFNNAKGLEFESAKSFSYPVINWDEIETFIDGRLSSEKLTRIVMSPKKVKNGFWLTVNDDLMSSSSSPSFPINSLILIDPDYKEMENGKLLLIKLPEGNKIFRQVVRNSNTTYLKTLNEKYLPDKIDESKCEVIGKIVGLYIEIDN